VLRIPVKIAVIGGGTSGLSCAFSCEESAIRWIYSTCPNLAACSIQYTEYGSPKSLDWEIQGILDLGVKSFCHVKFGVDFGLGSLMAAGYNAVF
jgi:hypothetical protein